jgi:P4 family phage/plasmid primase-like protien
VDPKDVPLLQEWMGYCLYPSYKIHAALWIHGLGRNGKGVYDRTILGLVGKENACHISLAEINNRFSLKEFYGKIYHSSSEPPTHKPFRTETFQRLTGGDMIDAEFKGKNERVKFVNVAKLTIIGNQFPKILNPTIAFKDRMKFVKFDVFIDKKDRVPDLEKVWLDDQEKKSALFNWALEGLHRLLANGVFSESKTQEETEIEFQRVTDTPGAFIKEMGVIDRNLIITRNEARRLYEEYCDDKGLELATKSEFTQAMQRLAPKVKEGWTRIAGKNERAWLGFSVKDLSQMPQQNYSRVTFGKSQLKLNENENTVANVASVAGTAKDCQNFHKPSCEHPNPNCLLPTFPCPATCRGFKQCSVNTEQPEKHDASEDYPEPGSAEDF